MKWGKKLRPRCIIATHASTHRLKTTLADLQLLDLPVGQNRHNEILSRKNKSHPNEPGGFQK